MKFVVTALMGLVLIVGSFHAIVLMSGHQYDVVVPGAMELTPQMIEYKKEMIDSNLRHDFIYGILMMSLCIVGVYGIVLHIRRSPNQAVKPSP